MTDLQQKVTNSPISFAGLLVYYLFPYRKKVIKRNIEQVFKDELNAAQKNHLIKAFYSHLLRSFKEAISLRFMSEERLAASVEVRGHEHMLATVAKNKGVLVLTGHFGNWEYTPIGGVLNFKEFKGQFHFIRKTLGNKTLERILFRRYYKAGLHVIPKKNSLQHVCEALDNNHALIFVMDQHASLYNRDGIAVEFFGKKAGTFRSLATLARNTGTAVVPAASYRLPNGKHVLEFYEPLLWQEFENTQESLYRNTLEYNKALERIILAHPEQWMWLHKRWKLRE